MKTTANIERHRDLMELLGPQDLAALRGDVTPAESAKLDAFGAKVLSMSDADFAREWGIYNPAQVAELRDLFSL